MKFNYYGFKAIYVHEMNRFIRTIGQSLLSPVISTHYTLLFLGQLLEIIFKKLMGLVMGLTLYQVY